MKVEELPINIDIPPVKSIDISGVDEKDIEPTKRLLERILQNAMEDATEKFYTFVKNQHQEIKIESAGEKLQEPASSKSLSKDSPKRKPSKDGDYIVQKGDTLWGLAKKFNTTVEELARLNNIDDVNLIYEREKLWVPKIKENLQNKSASDSKIPTYGNITYPPLTVGSDWFEQVRNDNNKRIQMYELARLNNINAANLENIGSENQYNLGLRYYDSRWGEVTNPGGNKILYHNTPEGDKIIKSGFNGSKYTKKSNYNWFYTDGNVAGTGRQGTSGTLAVEGINVSEAHVITKAQTKAWSAEAMVEMGYTKESWKLAAKEMDPKAFKELAAERKGRMWSKVGEYMNKMGKDVYWTELDGNYAVSDKVANSGKITSMHGEAAKSWVKNLNGTKIAGRTLIIASMGLDAYRIATSQNIPKTTTKVVTGWGGAWLGATTFAGAAAAAGQMGPQIATPEEIFTVPIAGLIGGIIGYFWGEETGEIIYEILETQGWVPGGQE